MTNKNNILLSEITNNNNDNSNQISSNQRNEVKKEYDIWKDIGIYTYILFFVNIIYIITLIIYFYYTFDEKAFEECIFFLIFSGIGESIYIIYSFLIFFCKSKIEILVSYVYVVLIASMFTFILSLVDFTDDDGDEYDWHYKFTTTCKAIVISGSSIISFLSLIYVVLACKLIYCNKYVKIIYIN